MSLTRALPAHAVVPLLQERGIFRAAYEGEPLRETLGLVKYAEQVS